MKRYGIFSGWFTLFGVRGRISHILVLLVAWIVFCISLYLLFFSGITAILVWEIASPQYFSNIINPWMIAIGILLLLCFWLSICVTTQRLRHIGFRGIILFILVIIAIFPLPIQYFFSIDENVFNIVFGIYALFIFLYPGKKQEFFAKKDKKELNVTHERMEPKI
jgi:uncharacterized membrane protein YhaH (DUF805 family)